MKQRIEDIIIAMLPKTGLKTKEGLDVLGWIGKYSISITCLAKNQTDIPNTGIMKVPSGMTALHNILHDRSDLKDQPATGEMTIRYSLQTLKKGTYDIVELITCEYHVNLIEFNSKER